MEQRLRQDFIRFIIDVIKPEKIFAVNFRSLTGLAEQKYTDLLIVIPDSCQKPFKEFETVIEACLLNNQTITFSLHQSSHLSDHLAEGHIFYLFVCREENMIYTDGKTALPKFPTLIAAEVKQKATIDFEAGFKKATFFMDGARLYSNRDRGLAVFMLQQAAELTLRTFILALTGKEVRTHSILTFKKYCRRLAPELNTIFPGNTEEEEKLLQLLEKAYLNGRYARTFDVEEEMLAVLFERVALLQSTAKELFGRIMDALEQTEEEQEKNNYTFSH
jgi:HEPN domain-containing protein